MDRLVKRYIGVSADHARIAMSLTALAEASGDTYATDTNDVPLLNDGLQAMSKHLRSGQSLMEDEAHAWDEGVLEDLKRQRDALVSVRDLFDRRERLDRDNIPSLEKRIHSNETKLANLRSKPDGMVKPGEIDKVVEAIIKVRQASFGQLWPPMTNARVNRIRSLSSTSITGLFSSRSASGMSSYTSRAHSTTSPGGTRTGPRSASSTRSCWPTTGVAWWTSSRACPRVISSWCRRYGETEGGRIVHAWEGRSRWSDIPLGYCFLFLSLLMLSSALFNASSSVTIHPCQVIIVKLMLVCLCWVYGSFLFACRIRCST